MMQLFEVSMLNESRREQVIAYTEMLRERFRRGVLAELQPLNQWVVWRGEIEDGKRKKVPYNPNYRLARASVKIPKSWGTLEQALTALESGEYSGIGFVITPPLVMIDLDHSFDRATHTITDPKAAELVQTLHSYTEASPSNGLHILAYAEKPIKSLHKEIEMYSQDRFTTITTDHIPGTPTTIENRTDAIEALYRQLRTSRGTRVSEHRGGVRERAARRIATGSGKRRSVTAAFTRRYHQVSIPIQRGFCTYYETLALDRG